MKKYLITFTLLISFLTYCSDDKSVPRMDTEKPVEYVRYFKAKKISSKNHFRHILISFEQEIIGTYDEIVQTLKAISKAKETYYKVFYYPNSDLISRYEFYYQDNQMAKVVYIYGNPKTYLATKAVKLNYYDQKNVLIAQDEISYDEFGTPTQTKRFIIPGKELLNIF